MTRTTLRRCAAGERPSVLVTGAFLLTALLLAGPLSGQQQPLAFQGATLIPIVGPPIESGVLVVQGGEITAVGAAGEVDVPGNAEVRDVSGMYIMPGMVDTHSHIGGGDGGDRSAPIHGEVRILDALDARNDRIRTARAGGVTTANIMPGSGHLMSGQTAYVKLRDGRTIYDLLFCDDVRTEICGGMKMANGTNPIGSPPFPETRARSAALVRAKFVEAQEYARRVQDANGDPEQMPARNLELETLMEILDGRRIVHFHTHRHDDILTAIRLSEEFGFRVVLHHVSEAAMVAPEIAAAGVPSSIIVIDAPGGKLEAVNLTFDAGAALEENGADVAFHTDDPITDSRVFLRSAGLSVRAGMSREAALEALTLAGARMMDLEDRVGSLEVGKDADFVLLTGDPLSVYTRVQETWIDGIRVFDLDDPEHRAYAVGGYGVTTGDQGGHHHGTGGH
jgi:imidazolonepropionase-like amidohydrolase